MRQILITAIIITGFICSCNKPVDFIVHNSTNIFDSIILVDASRDGGTWWYPQAGGYSADRPHQGKALADYLRSSGYTVVELPRGSVITWDLLKKCKKVIRAVGFGTYTAPEIAAYDSFLSNSSSLLLIADHLQNSVNDNLSAHLGLNFSGSYHGTIIPSTNHVINSGVISLPYIAGSVIKQPDPAKITILGLVGGTATVPGNAAMGILIHPTSRVFFMGDVNGLESVPQPFTKNLVKWLF